jgi:hypothetical protein
MRAVVEAPALLSVRAGHRRVVMVVMVAEGLHSSTLPVRQACPQLVVVVVVVVTWESAGLVSPVAEVVPV